MSSRGDSEVGFAVAPGKIMRTNSIFTNNLMKKDAGAPSNDRMRMVLNRAGSLVDDSFSVLSPTTENKQSFFKPTRPQTAKNYGTVPEKKKKHQRV